MALLDITSQFPTMFGGIPAWLLIILMIWTIVWKGLALWKSARLNQLFWFVLILIINTFGILEILYIFLLSKIKFNPLAKKRKR